MKILITENQLEKVIDRYLSIQFKNLDIVQMRGDITLPEGYKGYDFINKNGKDLVTIFKNKSGSEELIIRVEIWDDIQDMFSLSNKKLRSILRKWFHINYSNVCKYITLVSYF